MSSDTSDLDPLQRDLLRAFFARTTTFRLTGGGALAGYHLHHRPTEDLDLFTRPPTTLADGDRALRAAVAEVGAVLDVKVDSPEFRRVVVERGRERTVVDLVVDRVAGDPPERAPDGVLVDTAAEIAANEVCTLLSRMEPRDLFDLRALVAAGISLDAALAGARRKDGGADPATLAWVLSTFRIPPSAPLPPGATAAELLAYRDALVAELVRRATPR